MVKSRLDPTIEYSELKGLDKTDNDFIINHFSSERTR